MSKRKKIFITTIVLFVISVIFTLLVKVVDVDKIGPLGSAVGFSKLNLCFHNLTGYNDIFYDISKYLGLIPFMICAFYGLQGIIQLIKNKSLKKIDKRLIFLGIFYVFMLALYVAFDKIVINYRPILEDGALESSYPSSHTLLAVCICLSSLLISKYYIKNSVLRKYFNILTWILMITLTVTRLLSGVHWLTDIIGGIIISLFLVSLFYTFAYTEKKVKTKEDVI